MHSLGLNAEAERRGDWRYRASFRVSLVREESPEVEGEVTALSAGGCFVEGGEDLREGDLVNAAPRVRLPRLPPLSLLIPLHVPSCALTAREALSQ